MWVCSWGCESRIRNHGLGIFNIALHSTVALIKFRVICEFFSILIRFQVLFRRLCRGEKRRDDDASAIGERSVRVDRRHGWCQAERVHGWREPLMFHLQAKYVPLYSFFSRNQTSPCLLLFPVFAATGITISPLSRTNTNIASIVSWIHSSFRRRKPWRRERRRKGKKTLFSGWVCLRCLPLPWVVCRQKRGDEGPQYISNPFLEPSTRPSCSFSIHFFGFNINFERIIHCPIRFVYHTVVSVVSDQHLRSTLVLTY